MISVSEVIDSGTNSELLTKLSDSFWIDIGVRDRDCDGFGHVNNAVYIQWLDQVHWADLEHRGITESMIFDTRCGYVVHKTVATYKSPLVAGDRLRIGTSIVSTGGIRMTRQFQLVRQSDKKTVLTASIEYVSVDLDSGRPKVVPPEFLLALSTDTGEQA